MSVTFATLERVVRTPLAWHPPISSLPPKVEDPKEDPPEMCARAVQDAKPLPGHPDLPGEVSVREAADILGVDKHLVLKYLDAGWLEWRDVSAPGSSRPTFRLKLDSVLQMRTTYRTGRPRAQPPPRARRRTAGSTSKRLRHIDLSRSW